METAELVRQLVRELEEEHCRIADAQYRMAARIETLKRLIGDLPAGETVPRVDYLMEFFEQFAVDNPGLRNTVSAAAKSYWQQLDTKQQDDLIGKHGSEDAAIAALAKRIHNKRRAEKVAESNGNGAAHADAGADT